MQPVADPLPAEQHDAEEGRLQEEGRDHLVGDAPARARCRVNSEKRDQFVPNW